MSSSNISYISALKSGLWATLDEAPDVLGAAEIPATIVAAPGAGSKAKSKSRKIRKTVISRSNGLLLLRYTVYAFMLCCMLYALYTLCLYLAFRDRLFFSLFIARSLVL